MENVASMGLKRALIFHVDIIQKILNLNFRKGECHED